MFWAFQQTSLAFWRFTARLLASKWIRALFIRGFLLSQIAKFVALFRIRPRLHNTLIQLKNRLSLRLSSSNRKSLFLLNLILLFRNKRLKIISILFSFERRHYGSFAPIAEFVTLEDWGGVRSTLDFGFLGCETTIALDGGAANFRFLNRFFDIRQVSEESGAPQRLSPLIM